MLEGTKISVSTYAEMLGSNPNLVTNQLSIKERTRPIKQATRNFKLELEVQIK